jgi:ATP synthase F1 epsilon subunit
MSLQVCIMAPNRVFWQDEAKEIILPTNTGQMGVLTNHMPLITGLDIGVLLVRTDAEWTSMAIMGGFALIRDNKITILVNEAELGSEIKKDEAEADFLLAKEALEKATGRKQKIEKTLTYQRARARCQV